MELLQVFDKNRNLLEESIERNKKKELPSGKYFMITLLFIQNSEGKFLIQKTSLEKGSVFATTGGHVTFGDDGLKTIIKEAKEELGLDLTESEVQVVAEDSIECCLVNTYYLLKDIAIKDISLQKEEVEYVEWLSEEEINKLIELEHFRKTNIKPFQAVLSYVKKEKH